MEHAVKNAQTLQGFKVNQKYAKLTFATTGKSLSKMGHVKIVLLSHATKKKEDSAALISALISTNCFKPVSASYVPNTPELQ